MAGKDKAGIQCPLKKDEIVTVTVEQIGSEGEGIAKYQGFTLFIKDAVVGDVAKVKVMKTKKTYGYARLMELVTPSEFRVTPRCEVARKCGGCQIQQLSYEKQLEYKQNKVKDCFERIGGFHTITTDAAEDGILMEPVVGMKEPYYYRNKSQFPIGTDKDGKIVTGFYAGRTHSIIDHESCLIGPKINEKILSVVKAFMTEYKISAYEEETHKGLVRHVLTRVGFVTGEVMVCLVLNGEKLPHAEVLVERLKDITEEYDQMPEGIHAAAVRHVTSICINVNREKTNVILGNKVLPLYGPTIITDYIGEIKYQISPLSFFQVNPVQTKKLYDLTLEYAELTGNEVVWDMYCGIGTISLFLAKQAKQVYGVEIIPQAIEDAKKNAELNGITNAEFYVGAAEEVVPEQYEKQHMKADVIVVDPPRKGCDELLLSTITQMQPRRIVYVSCDPATLARDARVLENLGYELKKFCPVDQFGHSVHVETVARFDRK